MLVDIDIIMRVFMKNLHTKCKGIKITTLGGCLCNSYGNHFLYFLFLVKSFEEEI